MKLGNLKILIKVLIFFLLFSPIKSEEKIQVVPLINLEDLSPTFEEDKQVLEQEEVMEKDLIKGKQNNTSQDDNTVYVNLKALDKITAKTSLIKIAIGDIKNFGKLEIKPLKCGLTVSGSSKDNVAYIQVKDLGSKDNNKVFLYNGWIFSSSPTLRSIDHPVYDLWLVSCDNV